MRAEESDRRDILEVERGVRGRERERRNIFGAKHCTNQPIRGVGIYFTVPGIIYPYLIRRPRRPSN